MDLIHYDILASIFYFPDDFYLERVETCQSILEEKYPVLAQEFEPFLEFVKDIPDEELEKIFIRTFDIQALCCLDVGYVLFGEDYTRGKILANLNKEQFEAGVDCKGELADRLPNLLRLMPRLQDQELLEEIVSYLLKPSIDKMIEEFVPNRIREKEEIYQKFHKTVLNKREDHVTKYRIPLNVLRKMLDIDFPDMEIFEMAEDKDYMESVKGEMKNSMKADKF